MNGDPEGRLLPATRQRVLEAAGRLEYAPSAAARILRGGRSHTILFLSPEAEGLAGQTAQLVEMLATALAPFGYSLIWQVGRSGSPRPVEELTPAVVLTGPVVEDPEFAVLAAEFEVPVLPAFPGRDQHIAAAAGVQAQHLIEVGCRALVFAAAKDPALERMNSLRRQRFRDDAVRFGADEPRLVTWPLDRAAGAAAITQMLDGLPGRVGIAAFNDDVALAVLAAAADTGVEVPRRAAVIGVDAIPQGRWSSPALTSVGADLAPFVAGLALDVVNAADSAASPVAQLPVALQLVVRASTY